MKKPVLLMLAIGALVSGCVAYEVPHRDGVPDRHDRRPDDPRRY